MHAHARIAVCINFVFKLFYEYAVKSRRQSISQGKGKTSLFLS